MQKPPKALVAFVALAILATALPVGTHPLLDDLRSAVGGSSPRDARGAVLKAFANQGSLPVAPGVTHDWGAAGTSGGPQAVHFVSIAGDASLISFEAAMSNDAVVGLERTTSMANRQSGEGHRAIAAINGDVWSAQSSGANAAPFGLHISKGELMTAGPFGRPSFGVDASGQKLIGAPVVTTNIVLASGAFHRIDRVNQRRQAGEVVMYTPRFGARTDGNASGIDVILENVPLPLRAQTNAPVIVSRVRPSAASTSIAPGTVVLTGPDTSFLKDLTPGTQVTLTLSITAGWENVTEAIGGREFLLRKGGTFLSPRPAIADERHPRTAIGIRADGGVVLATVDGRRSGYSVGVTNAELATLLAGQGVVDAINLDGGGSTAMAVRQPGDLGVSIVNRPSDGSERVLPNALVVYSSAPTGPLAYLYMSPGSAQMYTGGSANFTLKGQDAAYNGLVVPPSQATWAVEGAGGTVDANGRFTAGAPGTGFMRATVNGVTASSRLSVLTDTSPPEASPPSVRLRVGTQLGSTVPSYISWAAASDVGLGVAGYELQGNASGGGWGAIPSGSALNRSAQPALTRNGTYRFAVRASDKAGNIGNFAAGSSFRVTVLSEASGSISYSPGWGAITSPSYDGKRAMSTRTPMAFATYTFVGTGFAWIASKSPVRGQARIYIDGKYVGSVNTFSSKAQVRQVVFTRSWSSMSRHTIRIENVGTAGHPRIDIDAFVVLTAPGTPLPGPGQTTDADSDADSDPDAYACAESDAVEPGPDTHDEHQPDAEPEPERKLLSGARGGGARGRRRHRLLRAHRGHRHSQAAGHNPGHGLHGRRQRLRERDRRGVPELLRAHLGHGEGPDPPGAREPRVRHPRGRRLLRVLRGARRRERARLVRVRRRGVAGLRTEQQLRRGGRRRLRPGLRTGAVAPRRPRRQPAPMRRRDLAPPAVQLRPARQRRLDGDHSEPPLQRQRRARHQRPRAQLRAVRADAAGRRPGRRTGHPRDHRGHRRRVPAGARDDAAQQRGPQQRGARRAQAHAECRRLSLGLRPDRGQDLHRHRDGDLPLTGRRGPAAVEFRPLSLADAPAAYRVLRDCRTADGEPAETTFDEFVHSTFGLPTADVSLDSVGAFTEGGDLVGLGWAFGRESATRAARMWLLGGVRPDHRRCGLGTEIVRAGVARARDAFASLATDVTRHVDVEAFAWQEGRLALLEAEGFEHVRSFMVMHRPIDAPVEVPSLPAGLTARDWEPGLDEPARDAHNDAFRDHWASEPVGIERWRHLGADSPGFLAGCSSIAVTASGEVAGYVLCSAPPGMQREQRTAWIGTVGVRRDQRGRGVGAALLARSIAAMRAEGFERVGLDVDVENPTGAVRVYERLGFTESRRQLIYAKTL